MEMGERKVAGTLRVLLLGSLLAPVLLAALPSGSAAVALRAYVTPYVSSADPGDLVTYTVALDTTGSSGNAGNVWANLTVPSNSNHTGDSFMTPACTVGQPPVGNVRHYVCTSLPVANSTFTVTIRLLAGPGDGAAMVARLAVNYTDDAGVKQPEATAAVTVTMSIPVIGLSVVPSTNPVDPGAALTYTISINNTGSAASSTVWINDTLPSEVTFSLLRPASIRSRCPTQGPTAVACRLTNLAKGGSQTIDIDVTVKTTAVRGSSFVNWVFANFTDSDGTLLGQVSAFAGVDVRVIRDLALSKVADAGLAYPGGLATFTIWYNDTAAGPLGPVWLNDTLPSGMRYSASTPTAVVSGNGVRWQFPSASVGPNSVQLVVEILSGVSNGTLLTNTVTGDYVDGSGNQGQREVASASVTASDLLPKFDTFVKVASQTTVYPDATVRFTIYFNNTGFDLASFVTIEDTIPVGTFLANPSVAPAASLGRWNQWVFANVAPGPHSVSYDLVLQEATPGATLVNLAFLNATFGSGGSRAEPPRSAVVRVVAGTGSSSPWPLAGGAIALLAIAGLVGFRVLRRPPTVIDEVFLLHKDGLLIKHYTRRMRPDVDSDILSGMLIAVQNFVNESFIGSEGLQREGVLDELRFGAFRIVIERGEWVIVAAVLSGDPTNRVKDAVKAAIRGLEAKLGPTLADWSGDMRSVEGADAFMQDLITGKYRGAGSKG